MNRVVLTPIALGLALGLSSCVVYQNAPPQRSVVYAPSSGGAPVPQDQPQQDGSQDEVVSVYEDPPLAQPEPIAVPWAPPPMLVEDPGMEPYPDAVWTGGYWVWHGDWVWARGRWARPPRAGYAWHHPYYEHRDGAVIFVNGFWGAPGVSFVAPGFGLRLTMEVPHGRSSHGYRPVGPNGVFVPPPPGSRRGLIVPAPLGVAPAVVLGAPPIINPGMAVRANGPYTPGPAGAYRNSTVSIYAPPSATYNGQAVNASAPADAWRAAQQRPVVRAQAPEPLSRQPIQSFERGRPLAPLPAAQPVPGAGQPFGYRGGQGQPQGNPAIQQPAPMPQAGPQGQFPPGQQPAPFPGRQVPQQMPSQPPSPVFDPGNPQQPAFRSRQVMPQNAPVPTPQAAPMPQPQPQPQPPMGQPPSAPISIKPAPQPNFQPPPQPAMQPPPRQEFQRPPPAAAPPPMPMPAPQPQIQVAPRPPMNNPPPQDPGRQRERRDQEKRPDQR